MSKYSDEDLRQMLKQLVAPPVQVLVADVTAVNLNEYSIDVKPIGRAEVLDVRLKAGLDGIKQGIVEIPKNGSKVLIGLIGNDKNTAFLIKTSEVDEVLMNVESFKMNGGNLGGLIKIEELVDRLNKIEDKLNDFIQAVKDISVALAPTGSYPLAGDLADILPLQKTQKSQIENTKIKH